MSDTKVCCTCKRELPLSEFYKRSERPIGVQPNCKACFKKKYFDPRRKKNRLEGKCDCGRELAPGFRRCPACKASGKASDTRKREYLRANGICMVCRKNPVAEGYSECDSCSMKRTERMNGVSEQDRKTMYDNQKGTCPICEKPLESWFRKKNCVVDHDHVTGAIRGLIHDYCNRQIGDIDLATARRLVSYLEGGAEGEGGAA